MLRLLAALPLVAGALVGCGDSDGTPTRTAPSSPRGDGIAQLADACREIVAALPDGPVVPGGPSWDQLRSTAVSVHADADPRVAAALQSFVTTVTELDRTVAGTPSIRQVRRMNRALGDLAIVCTAAS